MAWEKRGNGRQYFYLSERQADGSVRKRYCGRGMLAEVESIRLEWKACLRQCELQERKTILDLESMTQSYAESTRTTVEAHFFADGFHNPTSRGWRRRREMIRVPEADEQEPGLQEPGLQEPQETETEEFTMGELVSRCRRGDKHAAKTLRKVLNEHPDLYDGLGQVSQKVQVKWVRAITGTDLFEREMLLRATMNLRRELIKEGTGTQLERLVIEQVVSSHLQQAFHESREAELASMGIETSKYRLDATKRASQRHVKAMGALATLRSMIPKMEDRDNHNLSIAPARESSEAEVATPHYAGVNRLSVTFGNQHREFLVP